MRIEFSGEIINWRGPAPFTFVEVPDEDGAAIRSVAAAVTYGWGMIPAQVRIGATSWKTSLFPKEGRYLVPIKAAVRRAEGIEAGDWVNLRLDLW